MLALRNPLYHCFLNPAAFLDRRRGEERVPLTGLKDTDAGDPRSRTAGERHLKEAAFVPWLVFRVSKKLTPTRVVARREPLSCYSWKFECY
jgi:hypothetical protein